VPSEQNAGASDEPQPLTAGAALSDESADDEDARISPASLAWFLGSVLLVIISCVIYAPTIRDGWTRYDNMQLIAREPMVQDLSIDGLKRMFTNYHHDLYQPLLTVSLALDHALNRRDPAGHRDAHWPASDLTGWHLHSLAIHLVTVVLLFLLIGRMTGHVFAAWLGTALVACHPLWVEPVSWMICRTFLLAGFWIILGCHFYLSYARRPRWWLYLLSFTCFGLSMLAKLFMGLFLLPLVFDLWCGRRRWGALLLEKVPLLLLIGVLVYFNAQRMFGAQRLEPLPDMSAFEILRRSLVGLCWTAANIVFPRDLSVFYGPDEKPWGYLLSRTAFGGIVLALTVIYALVIRSRKQRNLMLCVVGWAFLFVPLLAAIRVRETLTADRYNYVPLAMVALAVAWWLSRWFNPSPTDEPTQLSRAKIGPQGAGGYVLSVLLLAACGWLATQSRAQAKVWSDDVLLWQAAVNRSPHRTTFGQLANALITKARTFRKDGDMEGVDSCLNRAEEALEAALKLSPDDGRLLENYGVLCLTRAGDLKNLRTARQQEGDTAGAEQAAEQQRQRLEQALSLYQRATEARSISAGAWNGLGVSLLRLGRLDEARQALGKSLKLAPSYSTALRNLASVLRQIRKLREAEAAGSQDPQSTEALRVALNEEADLLDRLGKSEEASSLRSRAIGLLTESGDPDDPAVLNARAGGALSAAQKAAARMQSLLAPSRMRRATPEQQQHLRDAAQQAQQEMLVQSRAAEEAYRRLTTLNEFSSPAWEGLGHSLMYSGRNEEADHAFGRAVELDPNNVSAKAGWARLLAGTGQPERAVALLEQALTVQPDMEQALFDLFKIHYSRQRVAEATTAMEKLHQLFPENNTYRQLLRQLYEKQGRSDEAAKRTQPPPKMDGQ
jgi:Flp pilus assembly protein TadD